MAITMLVNDDPNASGVNVLFMSALGLVFALLALSLYRPLFRARQDTANSNVSLIRDESLPYRLVR